MGLIELIIVLAVCGCVWYLITTFIPMPAPVKLVITVLAVLVLCVILLNAVGIGHTGVDVKL